MDGVCFSTLLIDSSASQVDFAVDVSQVATLKTSQVDFTALGNLLETTVLSRCSQVRLWRPGRVLAWIR